MTLHPLQKNKKRSDRRRSSASSISVFSIVSFDIDKDVQEMERQRAVKREAGGGGGWTQPNTVTGPAPGVCPVTHDVITGHCSVPDVLQMPAAPVDVHQVAQPYMPGPAVYHPPTANI